MFLTLTISAERCFTSGQRVPSGSESDFIKAQANAHSIQSIWRLMSQKCLGGTVHAKIMFELSVLHLVV